MTSHPSSHYHTERARWIEEFGDSAESLYEFGQQYRYQWEAAQVLTFEECAGRWNEEENA